MVFSAIHSVIIPHHTTPPPSNPDPPTARPDSLSIMKQT